MALLEEEKLLLEERVKELTVSLEKALEQERVTIMKLYKIFVLFVCCCVVVCPCANLKLHKQASNDLQSC